MKIIGIKEIQKIETEMLEEFKNILDTAKIPFYIRAGSLLGAVRHGGFIPWDTDVDIEIPINFYKEAINLLEKNLSNNFKIYKNEEDISYGQLFARLGINNFNDRVVHIDLFPIIGITDNIKKQNIFFKKINSLSFLFNFKKQTFKEVSKSKRLYKVPFKIILWLLLKLIPSKKIIKQTFDLIYMYHDEKAEYVVNPFSKYKQKSIFPKEYYNETKHLKFENIILPVPYKYEQVLTQLYGDYSVNKNVSNIDIETFTIEIDKSIYKNFKLIEGEKNEKV